MLTREQAIANLGEEDVAARKVADAAWLAAQEASQRLQLAQIEARQARAARYDDLNLRFNAEEAAIDAEVEAETAALRAADAAAEEAWMNAASAGNPLLDWADDAERCKLTGFIICEEDDVSEVNGHKVLTDALGIDPDIFADEEETGGDAVQELPT